MRNGRRGLFPRGFGSDWLQRAVPLLSCLLIAQASFALIWYLREQGSLQAAELAGYDFLLGARAGDQSADAVVLIGETEQDLNRFGYPLPDATLAKILTEALRYDPVAIGIDKYRDRPVGSGGDLLARLAGEHSEFVWIHHFGSVDSPPIPPPDFVPSPYSMGFSDLADDEDGTIRRGLLYLDRGEQPMQSLSLGLALRYLSRHGVAPRPSPDNAAFLALGPSTIPPLESDAGGYADMDDRGYQYLMSYLPPPGSLPCYSLSALMDGEIPTPLLRGKVLVIGSVAPSLGDIFYTPVRRTSQAPADPCSTGAASRVFGIEVHGLLAEQLIDIGLGHQVPMRYLSESGEVFFQWGGALAVGLLGFFSTTVPRLVLLHGIALMALAVVGWTAFRDSLWLPLIPVTLQWLLALSLITGYHYVRNRREKGAVLDLFSRYVSKEVAGLLWEQRHAFFRDGRIAPRRVFATVLFTDIQGFTSISESLDPETLMRWLNTYMSEMAQRVQEHGGVVKQYAGDAVMAIFGIPVPRENEAERAEDAVNAVACALAMGRTLVELNRRWAAEGLPNIAIRAGIYSGHMVAGCLGSEGRQEYAVVGDTVNTAARLESFDKTQIPVADNDLPIRIHVGDPTRALIADRYALSAVGELQLKGKSKRVSVHRISRPIPEDHGGDAQTAEASS